MTRQTVKITNVAKETLKFYGNSRRLTIDVQLQGGTTSSIVMTSTPFSAHSDRNNFEWFWENAEIGTSCILVQNEQLFENFLIPPKQ